jgi:ankyrin repeat protein
MTGEYQNRPKQPRVDEHGRTPLHYAAAEGATARVSELLLAGLDPGAPDHEGWTPLHFAAQANSETVTSLLLDAGAAVDPQDSHGNTPLARAVFSSGGGGAVIKLLRSRGANPRLKNSHGVSPLELARTIGNYDVARFFGDLPAGELGHAGS